AAATSADKAPRPGPARPLDAARWSGRTIPADRSWRKVLTAKNPAAKWQRLAGQTAATPRPLPSPSPVYYPAKNTREIGYASEDLFRCRRRTRPFRGGRLFGDKSGERTGPAQRPPDSATQPSLAGGGRAQAAKVPAIALARAGVKNLSH